MNTSRVGKIQRPRASPHVTLCRYGCLPYARFSEVVQAATVPRVQEARRNADAPLFYNQSRTRISKRRVQFAWRTWQDKAGFDRLYPFHCLRHSAVTAVYRQTRDLFLAQRFARHVSPLTTVVYTHPSDDEMRERLRQLNC